MKKGVIKIYARKRERKEMSYVQVQFEVALYPEGLKNVKSRLAMSQEEYDEDEEDEYALQENLFKQYICTDEPSKYILEELKSIYYENHISCLQYIKNGTFMCKVKIDTELDEYDECDYIHELLWPADIHDMGILFIQDKHYLIDLDIRR